MEERRIQLVDYFGTGIGIHIDWEFWNEKHLQIWNCSYNSFAGLNGNRWVNSCILANISAIWSQYRFFLGSCCDLVFSICTGHYLPSETEKPPIDEFIRWEPTFLLVGHLVTLVANRPCWIILYQLINGVITPISGAVFPERSVAGLPTAATGRQQHPSRASISGTSCGLLTAEP